MVIAGYGNILITMSLKGDCKLGELLQVHPDATAHIVGSRTYGNHFLGDIDADGQTFLIRE